MLILLFISLIVSFPINELFYSEKTTDTPKIFTVRYIYREPFSLEKIDIKY